MMVCSIWISYLGHDDVVIGLDGPEGMVDDGVEDDLAGGAMVGDCSEGEYAFHLQVLFQGEFPPLVS